MKIRKITTIVFILFFMTCIIAQTESSSYKNTIKNFTSFFNNNQADSIYNSFAKVMQEALPIDKTKEMVANLKGQLGSIRTTEFTQYQSTAAVYKAQFDNGVFAIVISIDQDSKINGLFFKPYVPDNLPKIERNLTKLILPFNGEWFVFWGGDTEADNYHVNVKSQKNAFDFVIKDKLGKSYKTDGQNNEDYYCFGQKLIAPCDGQVVLSVDGVKDNKPGEMNPFFPPGNAVVIKTNNNEYIYLCHFKQGSVVVKEGQNVKQGDLLGLCGNSGNSSEAHLHFHLQNVENINVATGVKCYFEQILVNGAKKSDYSPIKGEIISNLRKDK